MRHRLVQSPYGRCGQIWSGVGQRSPAYRQNERSRHSSAVVFGQARFAGQIRAAIGIRSDGVSRSRVGTVWSMRAKRSGHYRGTTRVLPNCQTVACARLQIIADSAIHAQAQAMQRHAPKTWSSAQCMVPPRGTPMALLAGMRRRVPF